MFEKIKHDSKVKRMQLGESMEFQQFRVEVARLESWLADHVDLLEDPSYLGDSLDEVKALIKKHGKVSMYSHCNSCKICLKKS